MRRNSQAFHGPRENVPESPKEVIPAVVMPLIVPPFAPPRLLVSVRNPDEARAAIAGGCDILDIKEPHHGSLGMADPVVTAQIIQAARETRPDLIISAALGEVVEWQTEPGNRCGTCDHSTSHSGQMVPDGNCLLKIGCAGLRFQPDWRGTLKATRERITAPLAFPPRWVAVAYADWEAADAPRVSDIVKSALQDDCCGVLIDTFTKTNRWLLDWISLEELHAIADQVHAGGLFLALAGSLTTAELPRLKPVAVDVLAIRGAACVQGQRQAEISKTAVEEFRDQVEIVWR